MNRAVRAATLTAALALGSVSGARAQMPPACPAALAGADRLVLVLSPSLQAKTATLQRYERGESKAWKAAGAPKPAVLGRNGMAWAWSHPELAGEGPVKAEGDRRTPAGVFTVGAPFGFAADGPEGYVRLQAGKHVCVDDPASPHYNTVVTKAEAGGASGEIMAAEPLYRQGLFVDYPTSRERRGGSCIFIHTWRSRTTGTAGCIALAETDVVELQRWTAGRKALLAILPQSAWERLRSCFPGI